MKKLAQILVITVFAAVVLTPDQVSAQTNIYKLHSLFMYNFVKNIKWDNIGDEFVIGVYNNNTVLKEVAANFENKSISGKKFNVRAISSSAEAGSCQIVYIPKTNKNKATELIKEINTPQILVVTEEDLVAEGASISFELIDSKLNFKINKNNAEEKGLKISSSLLALGTVI